MTPVGTGTLRATTTFGLMAGPLLTMVDSSVVNVAASALARELHTGLDTVQWAVSGYLLALSAGLAATSYLARRYGTLPVYAAAMIGFTAASAACAVAPGAYTLITARAAQGLAAAPLVPLAMSMLLGERGGAAGRRIPAATGMLLFLAPALGPSLGGLLLAGGGWRWIFLINVPAGLYGLLALRAAPRTLTPPPQPDARIDWAGLALLSAGLPLTVFGLSRSATHGWTAPAALIPLAGGALLLAAYARWSAGRPHAALDLRVLRDRRSALALLLSVSASVVAFTALFLLPVFTQQVQGHTALATGLALLPQGVVMGLATALGERISARVGARRLVMAGFTVLAVAGTGLIALDARTPLWVTSALLTARAAGIGIVVTPLLGVLLQPLGADRIADGTTVFTIAQRLGGALGVGVLSSLLAARTATAGPVGAFHQVGVVLAVLAAVSALPAARLPGVGAAAEGSVT
ncbi:DHA2 family efflux MFS transporter permease subunit [Microtetraspora fusca]|uniref:DHA2 family efflux MFS transporter permease subunit n=1 Tax=Microtetraspora fusca TaxID=1997 RepID=UPI000A633FC6|nr:DHA2 family efflux MFS transporter permease subunit [Microtetraspora fusca]